MRVKAQTSGPTLRPQQIRFESAFVTHVTGPANIRVCGYNWLGDPWTPLSQPYSISRRAGPLTVTLSPARSPYCKRVLDKAHLHLGDMVEPGHIRDTHGTPLPFI